MKKEHKKTEQQQTKYNPFFCHPKGFAFQLIEISSRLVEQVTFRKEICNQLGWTKKAFSWDKTLFRFYDSKLSNNLWLWDQSSVWKCYILLRTNAIGRIPLKWKIWCIFWYQWYDNFGEKKDKHRLFMWKFSIVLNITE